MAYDKERHEEIQKMSIGSLVHVMLLNFEKPTPGNFQDYPSWQNTEYFWAHERLNALTRELHYND